ncbi:hypothetical protein EDB85DRAFT_1620717 [Lactarius pseudohatsudake]|nr:hypothetical protein EDB85DRAFT_1620717 [Lactarius pseudohatsudake]
MMLSTRELRTTVPSHSLHTHACAQDSPFRDRSHTVYSTLIRYPTHGEFYMCVVLSSPAVSDLLRSERHRDRELFIPAFQCPRRMQGIGTLGDGGKWVCSFGLFSFRPSSLLFRRFRGVD